MLRTRFMELKMTTGGCGLVEQNFSPSLDRRFMRLEEAAIPITHWRRSSHCRDPFRSERHSGKPAFRMHSRRRKPRRSVRHHRKVKPALDQECGVLAGCP
jgi:hypothetical protein